MTTYWCIINHPKFSNINCHFISAYEFRGQPFIQDIGESVYFCFVMSVAPPAENTWTLKVIWMTRNGIIWKLYYRAWLLQVQTFLELTTGMPTCGFSMRDWLLSAWCQLSGRACPASLRGAGVPREQQQPHSLLRPCPARGVASFQEQSVATRRSQGQQRLKRGELNSPFWWGMARKSDQFSWFPQDLGAYHGIGLSVLKLGKSQENLGRLVSFCQGHIQKMHQRWKPRGRAISMASQSLDQPEHKHLHGSARLAHF